jgi:hypothetical protein
VATPDPAWTDIWQTIFVGGQLAVLIVAAVFGWRQLREAKELREDQTRPFVVVDLDSPKRPFFDVVVKNIGGTMARKVAFQFDRAPESTIGVELDGMKMFQDGISTLPPGKEIRTLFDTGIQRFKSNLPDRYEVQISYEGPTGKRKYVEKVDLDFGIYWNRMSIDRREVHDLYGELKKMREEMHNWTARFGGGGLLCLTPEDVEDRVRKVGEQRKRRTSRDRIKLAAKRLLGRSSRRS